MRVTVSAHAWDIEVQNSEQLMPIVRRLEEKWAHALRSKHVTVELLDDDALVHVVVVPGGSPNVSERLPLVFTADDHLLMNQLAAFADDKTQPTGD